MKKIKLYEQFIGEELNPMEFEAAVKQLADSMPNHTEYDFDEGPSEEQIMKAMKKYQKDLYRHSTPAQKKEAVAFIIKYLTESIDEAARVSDERYIRSHGKAPKGWGKWMFSYDEKGNDAFEIPGSMNYGDAKKWVMKKAKEDNKDYVYVMEANDHEVGMAQGQLEAIINAAMDLQEKIGGEEKDLPGWIQSHITSSYEYLKQANDNFHELEEQEQIEEALKMLMGPLMVKIMKNFAFNSDPGIKAELRGEIQAAVEEVLKKHNIIVEKKN